MDLFDLAPMFVLGLLGTGHCIGMCGPLVVAFPAATGRTSSHLTYHAGRVVTYALVGALMGALGGGVTHVAVAAGADPMVWMGRIQVAFSLLAASILLVMGLARIGLVPEWEWMMTPAPHRIPGAGRLLRVTQTGGSERDLLVVGLLMGLLPCGLSYGAFARALAAEGPLVGAAMTLCFGLGTVPGLLAIGLGAAGLLRRWRRQSDLLAGMVMIGMAVSLLADFF